MEGERLKKSQRPLALLMKNEDARATMVLLLGAKLADAPKLLVSSSSLAVLCAFANAKVIINESLCAISKAKEILISQR